MAAMVRAANPGLTIHTVVEDFKNENLLFIGTEFGVFATLDGGRSWFRFMNNLPPVAVHDLVIHLSSEESQRGETWVPVVAQGTVQH